MIARVSISRAIAAAVIASVWAAAAFCATMFALLLITDGVSLRSIWREIDLALIIYLAISMVLTLVISIPAHLLLAAAGIHSRTAYLFAGAGLGGAAGVVITGNKNPGALIVVSTIVGGVAAVGYHRAYMCADHSARGGGEPTL